MRPYGAVMARRGAGLCPPERSPQILSFLAPAILISCVFRIVLRVIAAGVWGQKNAERCVACTVFCALAELLVQPIVICGHRVGLREIQHVFTG